MLRRLVPLRRRERREFDEEEFVAFALDSLLAAGRGRRPITMTTLLRIFEVFEITMAKLVRGLDEGIYERLDA